MPDQPVTPAPSDHHPDSARGGRPPALDDEKRRQLLALLNKGCSRRTAAIAVGCSPGTITRTANRDPDFAKQLAHAESKLEAKLIRRLDKASKKDRYWRAAGWLLERKFPEEYARRTPNLFTGQEMVQFFFSAIDAMQEPLTADQIEQIIHNLDSLLLESDPEADPAPRLLPLDSEFATPIPDPTLSPEP